MKHNNVIPSGRSQNRTKTWFNQPARKTRRHIARQKKAAAIFPRPTAGSLRPVVHGQTLKYNMKVRAGKGFSLEELKAASIPKKLVPTIGIIVDHRRRNCSLEGLQTNVQRLKRYKAKLVIFPRHAKNVKAGDSTPAELANATQVQGPYLPIAREQPTVELVKVTDEMKSFNANSKLRVERTNERHIGARLKRAAEAERKRRNKLVKMTYGTIIALSLRVWIMNYFEYLGCNNLLLFYLLRRTSVMLSSSDNIILMVVSLKCEFCFFFSFLCVLSPTLH